MRKIKKLSETPKLTGEQIVQKKLDEANVMLRNADLSTLPRRNNIKIRQII